MKKTILNAALISGMLVVLNNQTNAQWLTTGNALATTGFLGSTTNFDLSLITNNTSRLYITKQGNVGIGTNTPAFLLDVFSTGNASANFKSSTGTANLIIDRGNATATSSVSYRTAGSPTWQTGTIGGNNFTIRNIALGNASLTVDALTNNVGIGTNAPTSRLHLVGAASQTTPVLNIATSYVGSSDVRGINVVSKPADGYGYGIQTLGGYYGGYFTGDGGTYIGNVNGVYGYASGSAGTRYGVNGYAYNSGGDAYGVYGYGTGATTEQSWGGFFPVKTYTNELRVGTTSGATGYVACFGGKVIATEVRVQLQPWPDYVFANDYNLMSIDDLEISINDNKHLPGLPAACDIEENGLQLGEMQGKIVEKLEEAHLYIIQLKKEIDLLKAEMKTIKQ